MELRTAALVGLAGFGAVTVGASTAIDYAIDRTGHDHDTWAYRHANTVPRASRTVGLGLVAAGLGARLLPQTRGASNALIGLGAGAVGAWAATNWGWRLIVALQFDARDRGVHWNPSDIARNSLDRTHMMGREPGGAERSFENVVSIVQGRGPLDRRIARGEFVPVWQPGDPPPGL